MKFKNLLFTSFILFSFFQIASAQEVAQVQQSLITKRTATWCSFCGSWGWTFFENLRNGLSDKAVMVAMHYGGSMLENPTSLAWAANFGGVSQPRFFVNNEVQNVTSSNGATAYQVVKGKVDNNFASAPLANVGLETSWNGDDLEIKTKTRFFQTGAGDFYLGVYLVEDNVMASQSGQSGQVAHMRILRASATAGAFGESLTNGTIAAGTDFSNTYTVPVDNYNIDNLDAVGVIWRKEGNTYQVVNVWSIDAKPTTSSVFDPAAGALAVSVKPNLLSPGEQALLSVELVEADKLTVDLFDMQGRNLGRIFEGWSPAGPQEIVVDGSKMSAAGMYALRIQTGKGKYQVVNLVITH
jgi:hypothetical protein